jgi:hypothetical protein
MLTVPLTTACVAVGSGVGVASMEGSLGTGDSGLETPGLPAPWQLTSATITRIHSMRCDLDAIIFNAAIHPGTNFTSMRETMNKSRIHQFRK